MKAMILAAGEGTRVQPLTYDLPKPMIPILGKPVMEYLVEELARHGFNEIMINVSHLPESIERYFGDGRRWGVEIGYSFEGYIDDGQISSHPLGSAGGLKRVQEFGRFFDDTFLVVCGDALLDLDLTAAIRRHWQSGAKASIVVKEVAMEDVTDYGVVVCDDEGRISSFEEKPKAEEARSTLINTGIYLFEPEILELIPHGVDYDIAHELFADIIQRRLPFYAINMSFSWVDIGKLSDFWSANQQLMRGKIRDIRIPGSEVLPGVWTGLNVDVDWDHVRLEGPVYIGANSKIESGCEVIGPTWISHGCHLQSGAKVCRSVLFEHSWIGSMGKVAECVISGRYCVDKEGNPVHEGDRDLDWVGDARHLGSLGQLATGK